MNPLSGIAGVAVDRMLGIRSAGVPFVLRRDVAVGMPDAWRCSVTITGPRGRTGRFRWC